MTFRNHRLAYWLEYVRHLSSLESPVIIVQNMCDQPTDGARYSPVEDKALSDFRFHKELHFSALNNRGFPTLADALQQAILWQWEMFGRAKIGKGRLAVKRKLEALRDEDASLPAGERKYRTLTQEFFEQLCTETGGVSNPALLLDYLHHVGMVFYQKGLFDDRIVLDQEWALQAVYAVFQREKCYRQLREAHGRFTRSLLDALVWSEYSVDEQKLFLSMMQSCGVCFVHRPEDPKRRDRDRVHRPRFAAWPRRRGDGYRSNVEGRSTARGTGRRAPLPAPRCIAWDHQPDWEGSGYQRPVLEIRCVFVRRDHPQPPRIEQRSTEAPTTWSGQILVSTRGGQAMELLERLKEWIGEELTRSGCQDAKLIEPTADKPRSARSKKGGRKRVELEPENAVPALALTFSAPPSDSITYCVSYAWNDESKAVVDRLCEQSKERGITILRDTAGLRLGESITRFMQRLAKGHRVFVILSDKYLKSPNCMYELMEVWRTCEIEEGEVFRRAHAGLPDVGCRDDEPHRATAMRKYWKDQFRELDAAVREDPSLYGKADSERYRLMQEFAHHVGDILALIADTLMPRTSMS